SRSHRKGERKKGKRKGEISETERGAGAGRKGACRPSPIRSRIAIVFSTDRRGAEAWRRWQLLAGVFDPRGLPMESPSCGISSTLDALHAQSRIFGACV